MASIKQTKGGWRAQVERKGIRKSKVFPHKRDALDWAAQVEQAILKPVPVGSDISLGDVFDRYARTVSPTKKGHRWEVIRLERFQRDKFAKIAMADLSAPDFTEWRDKRLREVSPSSVAREMTLLSAVLNVARREWGLIPTNPISDVKFPKKPPPRDRVPTLAEFEALELSAGPDLANDTARAYHAFLFACETAMRAGEIVGLTWRYVDLDRQVAHLPVTKNGHARDVPLSKAAVGLLRALPYADPVFGLRSDNLDALWRKLRDRAGVEGLRFHDSRRYATSRLAKKLDVLDLAKMTGHRDLRVLLNTYYQTDAADTAKKLD